MVKNSQPQEGRDGGMDLPQNHEAVINAINYPLQGFGLRHFQASVEMEKK